MKKLNKKDYLKMLLLYMIILVFILVLYLCGYSFGSSVDWANQHIVLPEYFRALFYSNGKLIPTFAYNIGLGQNIFYFSYYGLLSPIILISYLFPFIKMYQFIQIISVISLFISVFLLYKWINTKYNSKVAFIVSLMFILNSPFVYHYHRHLMFVIYMPFMISALIGVDRFFEKKDFNLLLISTSLLIYSSYYFSVSGIITIGIYTLYLLHKNKKFEFIKLFKVIGIVSLSILCSCIILLPTIYCLINGRLDTYTSGITLKDILLPFSNFEQTFYSTYYSWGITLIYVFSILYAFLKKEKHNIFLNIIISLFISIPAISYVFNGFMYIDGKCFIPFIPVALLSVSDFINNIFNKKVNYKKLSLYSLPVILLLIISSIGSYTMYILLFEIIITLSIFNIKCKKEKLIYIPIIVVSFVCFFTSSYYSESYMNNNTLKNINDDKYYEISKIESDNLYRTSVYDNLKYNSNKVYSKNILISSIYSSASNTNYINFLRNIFQVEAINRDNTTITSPNNLLFNIYTSTKYIISEDDNTLGYSKIKSIKDVNLYENNDVLPIGYSSNKIMSKREFETLDYPYSIDALLNYIIIDTKLDDVYETHVEEYISGLEIIDKDNLAIKNSDDHFIINANKNAKIKIRLNEIINNKILIIKFNMNKAKEGYACSSNITINGITNALSCSNWKYNNKNNTFEYVLSSNESIEYLDINFTNDEFDISNISLYTIDYDYLKNIHNNVDELKLDTTSINNDIITGEIDVLNDGYLKITIPYEEKGFKLLIDGKETEILKVDETFIGSYITSGKHTITIYYETPWLKEGIILSIIGLISYIVLIITNKKKKN